MFFPLAILTCKYFIPNFHKIIFQNDTTAVIWSSGLCPPIMIFQDIQLHFIRRYAQHDNQEKPLTLEPTNQIYFVRYFEILIVEDFWDFHNFSFFNKS